MNSIIAISYITFTPVAYLRSTERNSEKRVSAQAGSRKKEAERGHEVTQSCVLPTEAVLLDRCSLNTHTYARALKSNLHIIDKYLEKSSKIR